VLKTVRAAALALVLLGPASFAPPAHADVLITPAARAEFKRGVALLRDRAGARYAEAYEAFQAAYAESPSPKILGNLGLCAMKLERDGEAVEAYERYLGEVGAVNRREQRQIVQDLVKLRKRSSKVEIAVTPKSGVTLTDERLPSGGATIINEYGIEDGAFEMRLYRGRHRITFEADGFEPTTWEVEIGKTAVEHRVALVAIPVPEPDPPAKPAPDKTDNPAGGFPSLGFVIAAATTGALGIATGVVGGLALSNKSSFDEAVAAEDAAEATRLRDRGQVLNGATDALLVSTGVAAGVAVVFLILDLAGEDEPEAAALWVWPAAGPGTGGLALRGTF
jgi:hypothetical protein